MNTQPIQDPETAGRRSGLRFPYSVIYTCKDGFSGTGLFASEEGARAFLENCPYENAVEACKALNDLYNI